MPSSHVIIVIIITSILNWPKLRSRERERKIKASADFPYSLFYFSFAVCSPPPKKSINDQRFCCYSLLFVSATKPIITLSCYLSIYLSISPSVFFFFFQGFHSPPRTEQKRTEQNPRKARASSSKAMDPEQTFLRVHAKLSGMLLRLLKPRIRTVLEYIHLVVAIALFFLLVVMHTNFVQQVLISKSLSLYLY